MPLPALSRCLGSPADDARLILRSILHNRGGRHREFFDLHSITGLIFCGVLQKEEIAGTADVVVVEMGEGDDIQLLAVGPVDVVAQGGRKIDAPVTLSEGSRMSA